MGGKGCYVAIVLLMRRVYVNAKLVILTVLSLYTANTSISTFLPTQNTGPTAQTPTGANCPQLDTQGGHRPSSHDVISF